MFTAFVVYLHYAQQVLTLVDCGRILFDITPLPPTRVGHGHGRPSSIFLWSPPPSFSPALRLSLWSRSGCLAYFSASHFTASCVGLCFSACSTLGRAHRPPGEISKQILASNTWGPPAFHMAAAGQSRRKGTYRGLLGSVAAASHDCSPGKATPLPARQPPKTRHATGAQPASKGMWQWSLAQPPSLRVTKSLRPPFYRLQSCDCPSCAGGGWVSSSPQRLVNPTRSGSSCSGNREDIFFPWGSFLKKIEGFF